MVDDDVAARAAEYVARRERRAAAEMALRDWARVHGARDQLVRRAAEDGLSVTRIYVLTGLARTTINRILAGP